MGQLQHMLRSPLGAVAALSVVALLGVSAFRVISFMTVGQESLAFVSAHTPSQSASSASAEWQQEMLLLGLATSSAPLSTTTSDTVAMIGPLVIAQLVGEYAGLEDAGAASAQNIDALAGNVARNIRAALVYKTYASSDIRTDTDTSYARMLTYRNDLRIALEPLLHNTQPELNAYAKYIETDDESYLEILKSAEKNYVLALENAAQITVPRDAVNYHKDVLNALSQFAAVIREMATHPGDPLASAALLRAFNDAELAMYTSFNNLSAYYGQKTP